MMVWRWFDWDGLMLGMGGKPFEDFLEGFHGR
jgi:hypothetical protein